MFPSDALLPVDVARSPADVPSIKRGCHACPASGRRDCSGVAERGDPV